MRRELLRWLVLGVVVGPLWAGAVPFDGQPSYTFVMTDRGASRPTPVPDAGGTLELLSLSLAALAGIGWVRCRGENKKQ